MMRGEIWWANFDPAVGGEIRGRRPAIIVSTNVNIDSMNRVQVVPTTSNLSRLESSETFVTFNGRTSKAMADQLTTLSKHRFSGRIGVISPGDMSKNEAAMRHQLVLPERRSEASASK